MCLPLLYTSLSLIDPLVTKTSLEDYQYFSFGVGADEFVHI